MLNQRTHDAVSRSTSALPVYVFWRSISSVVQTDPRFDQGIVDTFDRPGAPIRSTPQ